MAKKNVFKSVIESVGGEVKIKYKVVNARIPVDVYTAYENAVERITKHNKTVSITNVIILALQEATGCINAEADIFDKDKPVIESTIDGDISETDKLDNVKIKPSAGDICPKCNEGTLVEKTGKNGLFLGCSRYPECK